MLAGIQFIFGLLGIGVSASKMAYDNASKYDYRKRCETVFSNAKFPFNETREHQITHDLAQSYIAPDGRYYLTQIKTTPQLKSLSELQAYSVHLLMNREKLESRRWYEIRAAHPILTDFIPSYFAINPSDFDPRMRFGYRPSTTTIHLFGLSGGALSLFLSVWPEQTCKLDGSKVNLDIIVHSDQTITEQDLATNNPYLARWGCYNPLMNGYPPRFLGQDMYSSALEIMLDGAKEEVKDRILPRYTIERQPYEGYPLEGYIFVENPYHPVLRCVFEANLTNPNVIGLFALK